MCSVCITCGCAGRWLFFVNIPNHVVLRLKNIFYKLKAYWAIFYNLFPALEPQPSGWGSSATTLTLSVRMWGLESTVVYKKAVNKWQCVSVHGFFDSLFWYSVTWIWVASKLHIAVCWCNTEAAACKGDGNTLDSECHYLHCRQIIIYIIMLECLMCNRVVSLLYFFFASKLEMLNACCHWGLASMTYNIFKSWVHVSKPSVKV